MNIMFFDIDGTLINTGGAGKDAMITAVLEQTGNKEVPSDILVSGRSDRGIGRELFRLNGLEEIPENWNRFVDRYMRLLQENLPQRSGYILPGVQKLLDELNSLQDVSLGLLTGNVREGAHIKLRHFGLWDYFAHGAFGDRHTDRADIARDAAAAARLHLDGHYDPTRVWVIGDTPNDVKCARAIGARAVAVATGIYGVEDLDNAEPDVLLSDLSDFERILALVQ